MTLDQLIAQLIEIKKTDPDPKLLIVFESDLGQEVEMEFDALEHCRFSRVVVFTMTP